jgi:nitrite reductase/ring-hydroxylating ferredoxin subunit
MATRVSFVNAAYKAYDHREHPEADEELTRVGPGTPCGEYLRRFWQPIILSEALQDLPQRLRIMGEDLVAFRDGSGAVGLLELYCPHRGVSLEFGLVSEKGLRCCYHGWCFDVDGKILDTPGEPPTSTLKDRLYHGAYPVKEYNRGWCSPTWDRWTSSHPSPSLTRSICLGTRLLLGPAISGRATGCR